jgi:excisionase family DNA binding protein
MTMKTKDQGNTGKKAQNGKPQSINEAEIDDDAAEAPREYYTVERLAAAINKPPVTVRRWLRTGEVKGVRVGRAWMIPRSEYERWRKLAEADEKKETIVVGDGIYLIVGLGQREFSTLFELFKPTRFEVEVQPLMPADAATKESEWTISCATITDGGEAIFFQSTDMRYVGFFRKGVARKVKQSLSLFNPVVLLTMITSATHAGYSFE